jgi:ATP-dependent DNA helicase RecG
MAAARKKIRARVDKALKPAKSAAAGSDRRFMMLAIDEMRKSRSEHEDKIDPAVGAVFVSADGKQIRKAYRGKFASGNHGEFTLLKKGMQGKGTRGGSLFVTLEPCTDRKHPKKPCAQRIVEAGIKRVVIGMEDPNPIINKKGIAFLKKHGVKVEEFDADLAKAVLSSNERFASQYSEPIKTNGVKKQLHYSGPSLEETIVVSNASIDDLSSEAVERYLESIDEHGIIFPSPEAERILTQAGFLVHETDNSKVSPTLAGIILFARNPHRFLPQARLAADRFVGEYAPGMGMENIASDGQKDIQGPLFRVLDEIEEFFKKHVGRVPKLEGSKRVYVPEYPWAVIREAIVNGLVHRDYQDGVNTTFQMYSDRIVIKSPGFPPPPLTLENFKNFDVQSYRRNPKIAGAVANMRYMEARGSGIPSMRVRLKKHGLREPEFSFEGHYFVVTIYGRESTPLGMRVDTEIRGRLNERQERLIRALEENKQITAQVWARLAKVTRQTATNDLKLFAKLGLVQKKGAGRATFYAVT